MGSEWDAWREGRGVWERLRGWLGDAGTATRAGAALDTLSAVAQLRHLLDQAEVAAVRVSRRQGSSWAEIAARLGVTRQSAWERWRELDEEAGSGSTSPAPDPQTARGVQAAAAADLAAQAAGQRRRRSSVTVPDVVGLTFDDARAVLVRCGLVAVGPDPDGPPGAASSWPGGVVTDQSPEAGAKVPPGTSVTLWLGHGGSAGVREPRRPAPGPRGLRAVRPEPDDPAGAAHAQTGQGR